MSEAAPKNKLLKTTLKLLKVAAPQKNHVTGYGSDVTGSYLDSGSRFRKNRKSFRQRKSFQTPLRVK